METLHPSCIHILRWSLKRSVKRTWTGYAFPTNESAWSVVVTRVWSGPKLRSITHVTTKMHVILQSFVVLTWMRDTIELV